MPKMIVSVTKTRLRINSASLLFLFCLEWVWKVTCFSDTYTYININAVKY